MLSNILIVLCANAAGSREPRWDSLWSLRRPRHIDVRNHRQRAADAQTSKICRLPKDGGKLHRGCGLFVTYTALAFASIRGISCHWLIASQLYSFHS